MEVIVMGVVFEPGIGSGRDGTKTEQDQDGTEPEWEDGTGSGQDIPPDYEFIA